MRLGLEAIVNLFEDNKEAAGNTGGGKLLSTNARYSKILTIGQGEMPADIVFEFRSTLDNSVVFTLQGCESEDFTSTPVHNLGSTITLTAGHATEQYDYGNGPDRFPYYRVMAVAAGPPTQGRVLVTAKPYGN